MAVNFDDETYGQRWQVETAMAMLKQHQGGSISARKDGTRECEMALMAITHNGTIVLPNGLVAGHSWHFVSFAAVRLHAMPDPSPHTTVPAAPDDAARSAGASVRDSVARGNAPATPRHLAGQTQRLFTTGPLAKRLIQHYRPYICPFGELIEQIPQGATVLDVGCGGGMFLGLLASAGRIGRGVGFDTSASAIETARAMAIRLPAEQQVLTFQQLDAAADWPSGPGDSNDTDETATSGSTLFDAVSIIDVMHHVPRRHHGDLIRRAAQRLKPGGTLLVKDIPPRPVWRAMANRLHDLVLARQWVHLPRPADIRSWADEAGLHLVRRGRINMLWYGHEMLVFEKPGKG